MRFHASALAGLAAVSIAAGLLVPCPVPAAPLTDSQAARLAKSFKAVDDGHWTVARRGADGAGHALARGLVEWLILTDPRADPDFVALDAFLATHPDWPSRGLLRRRAEEAMPLDLPSGTVRAWFGRRAPLTAEGGMRLGTALIADGETDAAIKLVRDIWINGNFGSKQERIFYDRYRKYLTKEDHVARLDRLLWDGTYYSSRRMYRRVDPGHRALAEARLALRRMTGGVDSAIDRVPEDLRDHPGLVYERLRWRRRKGRDIDARELLAHASADSMAPEMWWREREVLARRALQEGHVSEAYDLARHHKVTEGAGLVEAEWLAGWIALRFLREPDAAYGHFIRLYRIAEYPISRSRGAYWAARAAAAAGEQPRARFWYRTAAGYPTTYYGQMAAAEAESPPVFELPGDPDRQPEIVDKFVSHPMVDAVGILARFGEEDRIAPFIRRLYEIDEAPAWRAMVAELASRSGRRDLAVRTAKRAVRDGIELITQGYPDLPEVRTGLEKPLVLALIRQESAFDLKAVSAAGARGLMQLMPQTAASVARHLKTRYDPKKLTTDADFNLRLGQAYLGDLIADFGGSYILALAAYNAGPGRVRRWIREHGDPRDPEVDVIDWIEMIPFDETRNYVQRVMENLRVYRGRLEDTEVAFNPMGDLLR
jgi:soluble lytic murein transglycosylase